MNLTFMQSMILFYWFIFNLPKYSKYSYYLQLGLQPRYAFIKANEYGE